MLGIDEVGGMDGGEVLHVSKADNRSSSTSARSSCGRSTPSPGIRTTAAGLTWEPYPHDQDISRTGHILIWYLGADKPENVAYNIEVKRLLLRGMVARSCRSGCKFDTMIVLVGPQSIGKSTICELLAMLPELYHESRSSFDPESLHLLAGHTTFEVEELNAPKGGHKHGWTHQGGNQRMQGHEEAHVQRGRAGHTAQLCLHRHDQQVLLPDRLHRQPAPPARILQCQGEPSPPRLLRRNNQTRRAARFDRDVRRVQEGSQRLHGHACPARGDSRAC
ncbi:hypothetical protein HMPREF9069_01905 [Atopobium sp. oral taxon 810 str. F0209]|nr:hypothetical protein HMPREF9069_01905 [Atopobium sp. oral taxon 810 str. F0209]